MNKYPTIRPFGRSAFRLPCFCSSVRAPELDTLVLLQALNLSLFFCYRIIIIITITLLLRITHLSF